MASFAGPIALQVKLLPLFEPDGFDRRYVEYVLIAGSKGVVYGSTKNSDIEGAEAAAPGGSDKPSASMIVRSMLSC